MVAMLEVPTASVTLPVGGTPAFHGVVIVAVTVVEPVLPRLVGFAEAPVVVAAFATVNPTELLLLALKLASPE
jgi:hypothetical protein